MDTMNVLLVKMLEWINSIPNLTGILTGFLLVGFAFYAWERLIGGRR